MTKTLRWRELRKKIPNLDEKLDELKRLHPEFTTKEITQELNKIFEKELAELGVSFSPQQIAGVLVSLGYRKTLIDFAKVVLSLDPAQVEKIFKQSLPKTSWEKPFVVKVKSEENPRVMFINAPLIGLKNHSGLLRNALKLAQKRKVDAVVIPGNLVYMDLKRYSNKKPNRALFSAEEESEEVVFRSFKEKFDILVRELRQQFFNQNNKPYFKGKILISLGKTEQQLVEQYTNEIVRKIVIEELDKLREEKRVLMKELRKLNKYLKDTEAYYLQEKNELEKILKATRVKLERLETLKWLTESKNQSNEEKKLKKTINETEKDLKRVERELAAVEKLKKHRGELKRKIDLINRKLGYVKMTNFDEGCINRISRQMQKYIIYIYEKMLNGKVVSCGQVFLDIGGLTFQIVHDNEDSSRDRAIDKFIDHFRKTAKFRDLAKVIVVAGRTNITHSGAPISYRSRKKDIADSYLEQLPVCIDNRKIHRKRTELGIIGDAFLDAITNEEVTPGVVIYQGIKEQQSGELILKRETYLLPCLLNNALFESKDFNRKIRLIYYELDGDSHVGSGYVAYYRITKEPYILYHFQMVRDFLTSLSAPLAGYIHLGDIIQGHNYPFESQPPKEVVVLSDILKKVKDPGFLLEQTLKRGIFPCEKQIEEYKKAAFGRKEYEDYFLKIIERAKSLRIKYEDDLAPIIFLGGNHFMNTTNRELNDGIEMADCLRKLLKNRIEKLKRLNLTIDEMIKSPQFGDLAAGGGVLKLFKGAEYGFSLRHKEITGASKYKDPIRKIKEVNRKRGLTENWQQGKFVFFFSGHTHRGGFSHGPNESFDVGGSQTFHDSWGDRWGYPLNYVASKIIGIPVKGIAWGPIVRIPLEYSFFKKTKRYWKKWKINPKKIFEFA